MKHAEIERQHAQHEDGEAYPEDRRANALHLYFIALVEPTRREVSPPRATPRPRGVAIPRSQASKLERCGPYHRVGGEERFVHRAHVDVPAFPLRGLGSGQIAHGRKPRLHVGRNRPNYERALERIDRDASIGNGAIPGRKPIDVVLEEMARTVVGVDVRLEPYFRVHIDESFAMKRPGILTHSAPRLCRDYIHVTHLPGLGAGAGAAIGLAADFR